MSINAIPETVPTGATHPLTSAADPAKGKEVPQSTAKTAPAPPKQDTVELSGSALAKSLEQSGQTPEQIAEAMGVSIETVDSYLGIVPPPTTAPPATQKITTVP